MIRSTSLSLLSVCIVLSTISILLQRRIVNAYAYTAKTADASTMMSSHRRHLPSPLTAPIIIGYAHDAKIGKATQAIRDGATVIIWSFLHLESIATADGDGGVSKSKGEEESQGVGTIRTDLDLQEIKKIRDEYNHVIHLAAFGGWNGPHPPDTLSGKQWFHVFLEYNKVHGDIFDGIDWDYEGHDDLSSPTANFTFEYIGYHGRLFSRGKEAWYDYATIEPGSIDEEFSLDLGLPPRAWTSDRYHATDEDKELVKSKGFSHAGRQCYAYVLAKAGMDTFDWISIQLYEAYSPFAHDIYRRQMKQLDALMLRVRRLVDGYAVTNLPLESSSEYEVKVPPSKLVIGIANGWADGLKFCKVEPVAVRDAYEATMNKYREGFLGVMFWTIEEEGNDDGSRLAHSLNIEFQKIGCTDEL